MPINMLTANNERFIYDIVTDGAMYRVRYHKDTEKWSGKWYWLKHTPPFGDVPTIHEFDSHEDAEGAIYVDADRRRAEVDRGDSSDGPDMTEGRNEEINDTDNPF